MPIDLQPVIEQIKKEADYFKKAQLLQDLKVSHGLTTTDLSKKLELPLSQICHILRLLKLPEIVIDGYYSKLVSTTHLFILARLNNKKQMMEGYEKVLSAGLSSQQTEELVRELLHGITTFPDRLTKAEIKAYGEEIQKIEKDLKVKIVQTRVQGKIVLEIKGDTKKTTEILHKILKRLAETGVEAGKKKEKVFTLE